ncbi:MAG: hypothetical protein AAGA99_19295 [Actinomycetota bacterium]
MSESLPHVPGAEAFLEREWHRLAGPESWFTGPERVAIAATTRAARDGRPASPLLRDEVAEAAARLSVDAPQIDSTWVADLERRGLDGFALVEVMGIVSRLRAVDTYLFGLGHPERPLPDPVDGEPDGVRVDGAKIDGGFVPTVGAAWPDTALTAVAVEQEAYFDITAAFYMTGPEMGQLDMVRGLDRAQVELVAARTSLLNDCFF